MKNETYQNYSVCVASEPSFYGSNCTNGDAGRIAATLMRMVESEFPGITVTTWGRAVSGPDWDTCEEISQWISENWTAAL